MYLALARVFRLRGEVGRAIRVHQNLLLRGDLREAERCLALRGLAEDFRQGGFLGQASEAYEELLAQRPRDRAALRALVRLHRDARRPERALELARRLHRGDRSAQEARREEAALQLEVAELAHAEGRADEARRALRRALRRDPASAAAHALRGELEVERGRSKRALAAWRRALELDRRRGPELLGKLRSAFAALGRAADYEPFLRERLRERPDDGDARLELRARPRRTGRERARGGRAARAARGRPRPPRGPGGARAHAAGRGSRGGGVRRLRVPRGAPRPRRGAAARGAGRRMTRSALETPMMRQYLAIKARQPDAIVFYRMGDFYEMFLGDAELAAPLLEIALTTRDRGKPDAVPMCGVPVHAADVHVKRLTELGHRVAICEQVEDPSRAPRPRAPRGGRGDHAGAGRRPRRPRRAARGLPRRALLRGGRRARPRRPRRLDGRASRPRAPRGAERGAPRRARAHRPARGARPGAGARAPRAAARGAASRGRPHRAARRGLRRRGTALRARRLRSGRGGAGGRGGGGGAPLPGRSPALRPPAGHAAARLPALRHDGPRRRDPRPPRALREQRGPLAARHAPRAHRRDADPPRRPAPRALAGLAAPRPRGDRRAPGRRRLPRRARSPARPAAPRAPRRARPRASVREGRAAGGHAPRPRGPRPLAGRTARAAADELAARDEDLLGAAGAPPPAGAAGSARASPRPSSSSPRRWSTIRPSCCAAPGARARRATCAPASARSSTRCATGPARAASGSRASRPGSASASASRASSCASIRCTATASSSRKAHLARVPADYERKQTLASAERFTTPELREVESRVLGANERAAALEREIFDGRAPAAPGAHRARSRTRQTRWRASTRWPPSPRSRARDGWVRPAVDASRILEIRAGRHPVVEHALSLRHRRRASCPTTRSSIPPAPRSC